MISDIEAILQKYDRIFIIPYDEADSGLCAEFMDSDAVKNTQLKVYFIVDKQHEAEDLFLTYCFSSKVSYLSEKTNYGNVFNYYHAGLLTREEIFGLLLE